jgi:hypothetical protein
MSKKMLEKHTIKCQGWQFYDCSSLTNKNCEFKSFDHDISITLSQNKVMEDKAFHKKMLLPNLYNNNEQ